MIELAWATSDDCAEVARSGRTVLAVLPVGSTEAHGRALPVAADTIIARAFALTLARKAEEACGVAALLVPAFPFGYCPRTRLFPTTVSIPSDEAARAITTICSELARKDITHIAIVNTHKENELPIRAAMKELREESHLSVLYVNPYTDFAVELNARVFPAKDNSYKETALLYASLELLGQGGRVERYMRAARKIGDTEVRRPLGAQPLDHFEREDQHVAVRSDVNVEEGLAYFREVGERIPEIISAYLSRLA